MSGNQEYINTGPQTVSLPRYLTRMLSAGTGPSQTSSMNGMYTVPDREPTRACREWTKEYLFTIVLTGGMLQRIVPERYSSSANIPLDPDQTFPVSILVFVALKECIWYRRFGTNIPTDSWFRGLLMSDPWICLNESWRGALN